MADGKAPRIKVQVFNPKTGQYEIRNVSMELHHTTLPQRLGTQKAHEPWNLTPATPWGHASMDPYRHVGVDLIKVINGVGTWKP